MMQAKDIRDEEVWAEKAALLDLIMAEDFYVNAGRHEFRWIKGTSLEDGKDAGFAAALKRLYP